MSCLQLHGLMNCLRLQTEVSLQKVVALAEI